MDSAFQIQGLDDPDATMANRCVIGTGFLIQVPAEADPNNVFVYLVTAAHVIARQPYVDVVAPNPAGGVHPPIRIQADEWIRPLDDIDLVCMRWVGHGGDRMTVAIHLDYVIPGGQPVPLLLGLPIHYAGILTAFRKLPIPMVRTGAVAALDVEGLPFQGGFQRRAVHLVDCRSYQGFSGSPCYAVQTMPVLEALRPDELRMPLPPDVPPIGKMAHMVSLAGMFVAHTSDDFDSDDGAINRYGIGAMVRADDILGALMTDDMREDRAQVETRQPQPPTFTEASPKPDATPSSSE